MDTSREDFGIAIRSAFLRKGTKQRFSLFALIIIAAFLLFLEKLETKPLNYFRSFLKDVIYRGSEIISYPAKGFDQSINSINKHFNLYANYEFLKKENDLLKSKVYENDFLNLENDQLRVLIDEQVKRESNLLSSRVMLDKKSPYLHSFIINSGLNKGIKNGMAVLDGQNFIGRIVDVNFFSARVLLISDFNSKIPVIIEPSGSHAILNGHGTKNPSLEFLPENHKIKTGNKVYTSGKEGIFSPGIPIGETFLEKNQVEVFLFSDLDQVTFVNVDLNKLDENW